jgi:hypothetical protein
MQLELTNDEVNFIQQVLGELPTKTGAFLVMNNIAKQIQEQNVAGEIPKIEMEK